MSTGVTEAVSEAVSPGDGERGDGGDRDGDRGGRDRKIVFPQTETDQTVTVKDAMAVAEAVTEAVSSDRGQCQVIEASVMGQERRWAAFFTFIFYIFHNPFQTGMAMTDAVFPGWQDGVRMAGWRT